MLAAFISNYSSRAITALLSAYRLRACLVLPLLAEISQVNQIARGVFDGPYVQVGSGFAASRNRNSGEELGQMG